ncbi:MAG: hypothetical protein ACSHWZ_15610, partial [Sulfitobacter sp.]
MTCAFVIGTGRSGTSLAMQALEGLGFALPNDLIPASENNLRGTGESEVLRDKILDLGKTIGPIVTFRPDGWREHPKTQDMTAWLIDYLTQREAETEGRFAVKFPLSALYLPLWIEAAAQAKVTLKTIWATRPAAETVGSLMRSYGRPEEAAARVWGQRNYYILRDAPDDTHLLPFAGWQTDVIRHVHALASHLGTEKDVDIAAVADRFSANLAHPAPSDLSLPPHWKEPVANLDALLGGVQATLADTINRDAPEHVKRMILLADALRQSNPNIPLSQEETEMRLRLVHLPQATGGLENNMQEEFEVLSRRLREVAAENKQLRKSPPPPNKELAAAASKIEDLNSELLAMRQTRDAAQAELETTRQTRDAAQAELETTRQTRDAAQAELETTRQTRDAAQAELETTR